MYWLPCQAKMLAATLLLLYYSQCFGHLLVMTSIFQLHSWCWELYSDRTWRWPLKHQCTQTSLFLCWEGPLFSGIIFQAWFFCCQNRWCKGWIQGRRTTQYAHGLVQSSMLTEFNSPDMGLLTLTSIYNCLAWQPPYDCWCLDHCD